MTLLQAYVGIIFVIAEILGAKKKAFASLAGQINGTKLEIDNTRVKLEELKRDREEQGEMSFWRKHYLYTDTKMGY